VGRGRHLVRALGMNYLSSFSFAVHGAKCCKGAAAGSGQMRCFCW